MASLPRYLVLVALWGPAAGCRRAPDQAAAAPPPGQIVVDQAGFATPESMIHEPIGDVYFVSNINGSPLGADDNGFISVVSPEGKVLALKWIDGAADTVTLHAPKGMAVTDEFLYVADINTIRRFDRRSGAPLGETRIAGAGFLNDLAFGPDGSLYITDSGLKADGDSLVPSGTDAIYRLGPDGRLDTLAIGDSLARPNGVAVKGDTVWVVTFGGDRLYRFEAGKKTGVLQLPRGGLDGLVVLDGGDVFASSWDGNAVFRGSTAGPFLEALTGLPAAADIGYDRWRHRLLIPLFRDNAIRIVPLAF